MSRPALILLLACMSLSALALFLLHPRASGAGEQESRNPQRRQIVDALRLGRLPEAAACTPARVRDALGEPAHVARQILYHRYFEQWWYDSPFRLRLDFDCPISQPPRLIGVTLEPMLP